MKLLSRTEQTINEDVGERNWTFNIFSRARARISNPSSIKTDLKDLLRLAQWLFFIASQSEASNILTAREGWFLKVLLRVTSVSQPGFSFSLTDGYSARFPDLQTELGIITWKSYVKIYGLCPSAFPDCILSFHSFSSQSAAWGPGQTAGRLWLCVPQPCVLGEQLDHTTAPFQTLCFMALLETSVFSQARSQLFTCPGSLKQFCVH